MTLKAALSKKTGLSDRWQPRGNCQMGLFIGIEPMVEVFMEPGEEDVGADIAEDDESEHHYIWFQMKKQGEKRLSHKTDVPPVK